MCTQWRLRSAWASAQSDQSLHCAQWVAKDPSFLHVDSKDSDHTGHMPRLIWVFPGRTCHFVGFVMRWLKYQYFLAQKTHFIRSNVISSNCLLWTYQSAHDKLYKMVCAASEDSDQPRHPPSLIRVFAVRMKKAWFLNYPLSAQWRLWLDWADAQAYQSSLDTHAILLVLSGLAHIIFQEKQKNKYSEALSSILIKTWDGEDRFNHNWGNKPSTVIKYHPKTL